MTFMPQAPRVSRRQMLFGSAALVVSAGTPVLADTATIIPSQMSADDRAFLTVSKLLVSHELNPVTGQRIAAFARASYPNLPDLLKGVTETAGNATEVEAFFDDLPEGDVRDFASWVISAWYTGSSSAASDATLFTYEGALMYRPTLDMVTIPSFGFAAPNQWGKDLFPLSNLPRF